MPDKSEQFTGEIKITGIAGSPGICIGKAYLIDKEGVEVVEKYYIREKNLRNEVKRFKAAVKKARDELGKIIEDIPEELKKHVHILEAHMVLFKDKMLYGKTIETIEKELVNAEWALKMVVSEIQTVFLNISNSYLKGRETDIIHVSNRIMRNLAGTEEENISNIDKRVILVAHDLSPGDTSQIQLDRIMGFVTDLGGKTSHTGIIAQTLRIPSVLGLNNATGKIKTDDIIIVDGTTGVVILNPLDQTILNYQERDEKYKAYKAVITRSSHVPAETKDGFHIPIMGNIELPSETESVVENGGDGIGLLRTEFLYLSKNRFPEEEELFEQYKQVAEKMAPMPVTIRTLDINGDKAVSYTTEEDEPNPALGLRAIRFCLKKPEVFKTQLRAILRAAVFGNIRILFPMISTYNEILEAKQILDEAADSLEKEGIPFNRDVQIGIMVEVPSAAIMADRLAEVVDFFSIGTNDLIQYVLAIDRGNRDIAYLYNSLHPAVLRLIKHVVDAGKSKGIEVYMCGEMAGDPVNIPILLGLGIDELSMNPSSIPDIKNIIKSLNSKESRQFALEVLNMATAEDIEKQIQDTYGKILYDTIFHE